MTDVYMDKTNGSIRPKYPDDLLVPNVDAGAPTLGTSGNPWFDVFLKNLTVVTNGNPSIVGDNTANRTITFGQKG
ncbi:MAG: hypothetical protein HRF49_02260 [bacterium]